jgi:hypothetical protein
VPNAEVSFAVTKVVLIIAAFIIVGYGLHRLSCWAEDRGWIYYRKGHGRSSSASSAVTELQSLFHPSSQHVMQERRRVELERQQPGDSSEE